MFLLMGNQAAILNSGAGRCKQQKRITLGSKAGLLKGNEGTRKKEKKLGDCCMF